MASKPVRHINLVDDSGQVYCHEVGEIVALEGPHIAKVCWGCSYWTGLAGGYGVECTYQDDNLGKGVEAMTYRNAEDAKDHAPEGSVGSATPDKDAAKAADLRLKINPDPEKSADEIKDIKKEEAATDTAVAQQSAEESAIDTTAVPVDVGAPTDTGVVEMKKATVADIVGAIHNPKALGETKHLPGKHDQGAHAGKVATAVDKYVGDGGVGRADAVSKQLADMELVEGMPDELKKAINHAKKAWLDVSGIEDTHGSRFEDWDDKEIDTANHAEEMAARAINMFTKWRAPGKLLTQPSKRRTRPVAGLYKSEH